jgi:hypothetical protein
VKRDGRSIDDERSTWTATSLAITSRAGVIGESVYSTPMSERPDS